jgi:hypothetical protein
MYVVYRESMLGLTLADEEEVPRGIRTFSHSFFKSKTSVVKFWISVAMSVSCAARGP